MVRRNFLIGTPFVIVYFTLSTAWHEQGRVGSAPTPLQQSPSSRRQIRRILGAVQVLITVEANLLEMFSVVGRI